MRRATSSCSHGDSAAGMLLPAPGSLWVNGGRMIDQPWRELEERREYIDAMFTRFVFKAVAPACPASAGSATAGRRNPCATTVWHSSPSRSTRCSTCALPLPAGHASMRRLPESPAAAGPVPGGRGLRAILGRI